MNPAAMVNLYDIAYAIGAAVSAPFWLVAPKARRKVFRALENQMARVPPRLGEQPAIMIHAVSLGEINATPELVRRLRASRAAGTIRFIISTTTQTGFARGQQLYGDQSDVTLVRYPLDFSWVISRLLENLRPAVVVLMELEVWPNFLHQCRNRRIPVMVINGRMTPSSFARYRMVKPLIRGMFHRLCQVCVQDEIYAQRFVELGAELDRVAVTGTMKFDAVPPVDVAGGASDLAASVGLKPGEEPIWVCGSTGPGEEEIILDQYRQLRAKHLKLRLVLIPRHPQRFDDVANSIAARGFACLRRSNSMQVSSGEPPVMGLPEKPGGSAIGEKHPLFPSSGTPGEGQGGGFGPQKEHGRLVARPPPPLSSPEVPEEEVKAPGILGTTSVILGDTMGELRTWYTLADVVFVGRTLVDLGHRQHGSDMIEPAAAGKPVVVGPFTGNFAEPMARFMAMDAMIVVKCGQELGERIADLLSNPAQAALLGQRARQVVANERGATDRHVKAILEQI